MFFLWGAEVHKENDGVSCFALALPRAKVPRPIGQELGLVEVSVFVVLVLWRASHVQQGLYAGRVLPIGLCVWFSDTRLDHCGFTGSLRAMVLCAKFILLSQLSSLL